MKTNQVMIRRDERFIQRTKDGYFNATNLLNSWNNYGHKKKKLMSIYNKLKITKDFIEQLKIEGVNDPLISSTKGTWMHPKLFIDFAMWLSVEFKSLVIDYVLDGLIKSRHDAGDYYNQMCASILNTYVNYYGRKPPATIYVKEARLIKSILGVETKDRNEMTEKELSNITVLQKFNSELLKKNTGKQSRVRLLNVLGQSLL